MFLYISYLCVMCSYIHCSSFLFCTEVLKLFAILNFVIFSFIIHVHVHLFRMLQRLSNSWKNANDISQARIMNCWQLVRNLRRWDLECYGWRRHWLKREGRKWRKKLNSAQCKGYNYVCYLYTYVYYNLGRKFQCIVVFFIRTSQTTFSSLGTGDHLKHLYIIV